MKRNLLLRGLCLAVVAGLALALLTLSQRGAGAQVATRSVIVELTSDPVVVAKARAESSGQTFDVNAYRQQVVAEQNDFLSRLSAKGVESSGHGGSELDGPIGAVSDILFRFIYFCSGAAFSVTTAAVPL